MRSAPLALGAVLLAAVAARGDDWPRFRGPNGTGAGAVSYTHLTLPTKA